MPRRSQTLSDEQGRGDPSGDAGEVAYCFQGANCQEKLACDELCSCAISFDFFVGKILRRHESIVLLRRDGDPFVCLLK